MSQEWNAADYDRLSLPQFQWGQRVLGSLHLRGDETVLDAGCGTGRLTALLAQNLPKGRAIGVDLSRNMVALARKNLVPEFGDRITFVAADLLQLPFRNAFDGIFSTASFHWVLDHDALFSSLYEALRSDGWLHAQCGGGPNLARLRERVQTISRSAGFSQWLADFREPWFFSDAHSAAVRLRSAGFLDVETSTEAAPFTAANDREFQDYLRTFVLHRYLEFLPGEQIRRRFLGAVTNVSSKDDPPFTLDYWRLNLRARRPE